MKKTASLLLAALLGMTAAAAENVLPVLNQKAAFCPGKIGKALQCTDATKLQYPASAMDLRGGTVELWVCPDEVAPGKQIFLVSNGNNNPSWLFWGFDAANTNFLARSKKDAKTFHYYSSMRIPFSTPAKTWTHFALVWCNVGPGESLVQLYVNGKVLLERFDQSLGENTVTPVGIGHNTAATAQPAFRGCLDELRISNAPRTAEEIQADYQAGLEGKSLAADDRTLLYAAFEDTVTAQSGAAVLPKEKLQEIGNDLLDKLVGE